MIWSYELTNQGVPLYEWIATLAGVKPPYVLPCPAFNVINGGSHAGNALAFQEFMLLPTGASSFTEAVKMGTETYHVLKKVITKKYGIDGKLICPELLGDKADLQPPTSVTREVSPPTSLVPRSPLSSSPRPSSRLATPARSRSVSTLPPPNSTRRASTTLTSR
jgi:hypothetical protein